MADEDTRDDGEEDGGGTLDILGDSGESMVEQQKRSEEAREEGSDQSDDESGADTNDDSEETVDSGGQDSDEEDLPAVKDREERVLAYLPEPLAQKWKVAESQVQLKWRTDGDGSDLNKLRHIYPILLLVGVSDAEDLSVDEIAELKEKVESWDKESISD